MRYCIFITTFLMIFNNLIAQPNFQQNNFNSIFSIKFNSDLNAVNNGMWYAIAPNNLNGHFEEDSKVILGLITMYESTGNLSYLQNALKHFDLIISKRDDRTSSTYNNLKTWSTKTDAINCNDTTPINVQGLGFSNVYNDGNILYPMAKFVRVVYQNSNIRNTVISNNNWQYWQNSMTFIQVANSLIDVIQETVAEYEVSWNVQKRSYTYSSVINPYITISRFANVVGLALPLNQNHSIGRVFLELIKANTYNINGSLSNSLYSNSIFYFHRISLMIDCLREELNTSTPSNYDYFIWRYFDINAINLLPASNFCYPGLNKNSEMVNIEDYAHADITLEFIYLSHYFYNGQNFFTNNDMIKFAKTIKRAYTLYNHNGGFFKSTLSTYNDVDGTLSNGNNSFGCTNLNKTYTSIVYHLLYSEFDQEILNISNDNIKYYTSTIKDYYIYTYSSTQMNYAALAHKYIINHSPITFKIFGNNYNDFSDNKSPNLCAYQINDIFSDIVTGNFFNDSKSEIITVSRNGSNFRLFNYNTSSNTLNNFSSYYNNSSNNMLWYLAAGNFDSDNYDEIIGYRWNDGQFYCYEVLSNGTIVGLSLNFNNVAINKINLGGICVGNFDSDSYNEIATVNYSTGNIQILKKDINSNSFYVYKELINGGSNAIYKGITAADLDGDGIDEIVVMRNFDGNIYTYKSTSNYFLSPFVSKIYNNSNIGWADITSGDVNNDGKDELILTNTSDGEFYYFNLNSGQLNNYYKEHFTPLMEITNIAIGNIDGDCLKDIIYTKNVDNTIHVDEYILRNYICNISKSTSNNSRGTTNEIKTEDKSMTLSQLENYIKQKEIINISVFDISGRQIAASMDQIYTLNSLSFGYYIVNIQFDDNTIETIKYIVK